MAAMRTEQPVLISFAITTPTAKNRLGHK